jgi:3-oxoacyl-[acyl-carrier protein] reductase
VCCLHASKPNGRIHDAHDSRYRIVRESKSRKCLRRFALRYRRPPWPLCFAFRGFRRALIDVSSREFSLVREPRMMQITRMDLGLRGKNALVCGASSGLGLAIARELAREGANVALVARRESELLAHCEAITAETGVRAVPVPADLSQPDAPARVAAAATDALGSVDICVANAGGPPSTVFESTTDEQYQSAITLNLMASVRLAHAVVPGMRARKWGRMIFMSSFVAKQPMVGLILSNTARAGLLGFAKTLASEVGRDGVTVNSVLPGHFDTPRATQLAEMRAAREGRSAQEITAARASQIPVGRAGDPREMAAVVAFIASERAGYLTGTAIQVDGGQVGTIL